MKLNLMTLGLQRSSSLLFKDSGTKSPTRSFYGGARPKTKISLTLVLLLLLCPLYAQELSGTFRKEVKAAIAVQYILQLPEKQTEKMPLLVFLHGSGERGTDVSLVKKNGPFTYPELIPKDLAILAPQCPADQWWNTDDVYELIQFICEKYSIDTTRIYLTGLSMGGWGTWKLATERPELFAAVAPVCGVTDLQILDAVSVLKNTPVHIYHGALDDIVLPQMSLEIYQHLKKVNPTSSLTIFPNDNHNSWDSTYSDPKFYEWIYAQKKITKN